MADAVDICKGCKQPFEKLLKHLGPSKRCKAAYGKAEYDLLRSEGRKKAVQTYRANHKQELLLKHRDYNAANKVPEAMREERKAEKSEKTTFDRILSFRQDIIEGPNFVCRSCNRCLFKKSVKILSGQSEETLMNKCGNDLYLMIIAHKQQVVGRTIFCHSCYKSISEKKVPKLNVSNGLALDPIPPELKLTDLEQQLIAIVQIFMKIKKLPKHMMNAIFDTVINVPMEIEDIEKTVSSLPRAVEEAEIVAVKLKRKMSLKSAYLESFISPEKVMAALRWLKKNNPHYVNIMIERNVLKPSQFSIEGEDMEIDQDPGNESDDDDSSILDAVRQQQSKQDSHTCLVPMNLEEQVVTNDTDQTIVRKRNSKAKAFAIAPGENKLPTHWSSIKKVDEKAFITLFPNGRNGVDEVRSVKLTSQQHDEQRLLNEDPRFSESPPYVFYSQQRQEHEKLQNYIQIAGQRGKSS